jgi:hypothetical protein
LTAPPLWHEFSAAWIRAVSGLELTGLAVMAVMESRSGSVVLGEAKAVEVRVALSVAQITARFGKRGSNGKRPSNVVSNA